MADITYTLTDSLPEEISGFEQYSEVDKNLIESFQINSLFDSQKHFTELHIYSVADELLESETNYNKYKLLGNAQSTGNNGASVLTVDPIEDSISYGYPNGGVKLLYHFINDLFTPDKSTAEFFINGISDDRTELRLLASTLDGSIVEQTAVLLAEELKSQSYFNGFRLNFGNNDLLIGINIGVLDYNDQKAVTVKLYEPLPSTYDLGSTLNIVETVSDSVSYEIDAQTPVEEVRYATLRSPNFNIDVQDHSIVPSEYLSYNDLFSYPVNNSNSQIYSMFNEKGIDISVNYDNFSDFVHFSSAQERLINFKYKIDLISSYSASLSQRAGADPTFAGTSGSKEYYNNLITGIVNNFDHYERHLYYKSGSTSWPKTNNTKPYINAQSLTPGTTTPNSAVTTWYTGQVNNAAYYDSINTNLLVNTIPSYLRDDANNENYLTFIHMIGQHFDNLWLYGKAVSDKYDADNRLDFGISRDLVAEALKNFGVQLYTSNKSVQDLFTTIIGQSYQSGSEQITNYITGSYTGSNAPIEPSSYDSYQKEVYKRIYHNLPLLLSAKGTERGLRALINCFGIPQDILQIKLYGGRNRDENQYYGDFSYYTSSLDKIRLDNTGSIVTGSTLSNYTSIVKRDDSYTDDLHPIEVGFSPTDNIDSIIRSGAPFPSIDIGTQRWTLRNLEVEKYTDGTVIPQITNGTTWAGLTTGAWCYYSNLTANGPIYGKLYNWYAIAGIHNAASLTDPTLRKQLIPRGWHIPTAVEWGDLATSLGGVAAAGPALRATGSTNWTVGNTNTNTSGFTALGSGARLFNGTFANTKLSFWAWASDEYDATNTYTIRTDYTDAGITISSDPKKAGYAVRLVQDAPSSFNIDDYLGDPRNLTTDTYYTYSSTGAVTSNLADLAEQLMNQSAVTGSYNMQDYVRLIKFFDNTVFKMIKDFIPARTVADTGIIIKPHLLSRSKAKSVILSGSRPEYSGSIDTAFISSRSTNNFRDIYNGGEASTQYIDYPQTPTGIGVQYSHFQREANYNGEVSGSIIHLSDTDINSANPYKTAQYSVHPYPVYFISKSNEVCLLNTVSTTTPFYITSSTYQWNANEFFTFTNTNCVYSVSDTTTAPVFTTTTFPRSFTTIPNPLTPGTTGYYRDFYIRAVNNDIPLSACQKDIQVRFATCSMYFSQTGISTTNVKSWATGEPFIDLTTWVTNLDNQTLEYTLTWNISGVDYTSGVLPTVGTAGTTVSSYKFSQPQGTYVTLTVKDPNVGNLCQISKEIYVGVCTLGIRPKSTAPQSGELVRGFEFTYSRYNHTFTHNTDLAQAGTDYITDPATGEITYINPTYDYFTFVPQYLGFRTYSSGNGTRYKGIQAYFTDNGILGPTFATNPNIRYSVYALTNPTGTTPTSTTAIPYYNLTPILKDINPFTPVNTWGAPSSMDFGAQNAVVNTVGLSDTSLYGYSQQDNSAKAIVLTTPAYNTIIDYVDGFTQDIPKTSLQYAYVIEAYRVDLPSCIQRVIVYGNHTTLGAAEGPGTYPQFTFKNILANWDYNLGEPTPGFPTVPAGDYGPWITMKVRSYSTSPQTPAVTPP